jgi:hypothetical protein
MHQRRIVILGGYGVFGRIIAAQLAQCEAVHLVIAGRNPERGAAFARTIGATLARCDVNNCAELNGTLADAFLVIHTAGPFTNPEHPVARACLAAGAHYIDIADDPAHVTTIAQFDAGARDRTLCFTSGASSTPAITAAMVAALCSDGLRPDRIAGAISPGNRNPRGVATIAAILRYVGEPVPVMAAGRLVEHHGWHNGETVNFPRPVGRRRVYTVDTPDTRLFPARFGAQTVTFKAGLELPVLGAALSVLARLRRRRLMPNLADQARALTLLSWAMYAFGSPRGALGVWVEGRVGERFVRRSLALVAPNDGPLVAAAPALLLARRLLAADPPPYGAAPCLDQIGLDELVAFLAGFGMRAVWGDERGWRE